METSYSTFEEKQFFFSLNKKIDTEAEFDQFWCLLHKLKETQKHIFRGIEGAKFKLLNSAQRFYTNQNLSKHGISYEEFITNNIELTKNWNNSTIQNYLSQRGIKDNCISFLSIMQHYKIPTPLLDFSKNPFVALFFSSQESPLSEVTNEIDAYSSLYLVFSDYWLLRGFHTLFNGMIKSNKPGEIQYSDLDTVPFLLFFDAADKFQIINNQHIINQEGLFFFTYHPHMSIEEHYKLVVKLHKNLGNVSSDTKEEFLVCWNLNKKLNNYIRLKLKSELGITQEFLFPNFNDLKLKFDEIAKGYVQ